jgi:hypothetical protein
VEPLIENIDYYLDELGRMVFTENYHLKRGYCCGNGCVHCPWKNTDIDTTLNT